MTGPERRREQNRLAQARWRAKHPNAMKEYYAENRDFMLEKMRIAYQERKSKNHGRNDRTGESEVGYGLLPP